MRKLLHFQKQALNMVFEVLESGKLCLLHCSISGNEELPDEKIRHLYSALDLHTTGSNIGNHHGAQHSGSDELYYQSHTETEYGITFLLKNDIVQVELVYQFYPNVQVIRSFSRITNITNKEIGIEYISSFSLVGLNDVSSVMIPHNAWCREANWRTYSLDELGYHKIGPTSTKRISVSNTGTWSTKEFLPMGCMLSDQCTLLWQIEHNGSWHWEISDIANQLYLKISGPTEAENGWWKSLKPNETFSSVPCAVAFSDNGFDSALAEMTKYRRNIRRKNTADASLPVIFNDYMNCLNADPTTEKLLPIIHAAAKAGAEYFCMDAGWYADGAWWDTVGEWKPSGQRFPNGMKEVFDVIKSHGMIPGIWLEPEVMGIYCPLADQFDDSCFFMRHGKRVIDLGRYQLDFRSRKVTDHLTGIVENLINEYGVGYFKFDYNIEAGIGTEIDADSFGDGLLQANRAYLRWVESLLDRHPGLIIENCSSGGMRMDYANLAVYTLQSVTDQTDYRVMAAIAASSPTAVLPEQAAIWSYPLADADENEIAFNMINAMLTRIHLSGKIAELPASKFSLVKEGVAYYKKIRCYIPHMVPFYPLGTPDFQDQWLCVGYQSKTKIFLSVWRLNSNQTEIRIPLPKFAGKLKCAYPSNSKCTLNQTNGDLLTLTLPTKYSAILLESIDNES